MQMTMRWYGSQYDTVTLQQIRQTAYVKGVISTLYNKMPGELWTYEEIMALKKEMSILIIILKRCRHWAKRIFIWYVIILCQYLTGLVQSLHV